MTINFKKYIQMTLLMGGALSIVSCELAEGPNMHKKEAKVVNDKSQVKSGDLEKMGDGCTRGAFAIDVIHNLGGMGNAQIKLFPEGKGFVTKDVWKESTGNVFSILDYDVGEVKKEIKHPNYLTSVASVRAHFFTGTEVVANQLDSNVELNNDVVSSIYPDLSLVDNRYIDELVMRLKGKAGVAGNHYAGNFNAQNGIDSSLPASTGKLQRNEAVTSGVVGVYTHMSFGYPGLGYGLFTIPDGLNDESKTLEQVLTIAQGDALSIPIQPRSNTLPEGVKKALLTVHVASMAKDPTTIRIAHHIVDEGQSEIVLDGNYTGSDLKPGFYEVGLKREYLYAPTVNDATGGNLCVLLSAAATAILKVEG